MHCVPGVVHPVGRPDDGGPAGGAEGGVGEVGAVEGSGRRLGQASSSRVTLTWQAGVSSEMIDQM